MEIITSQNVRIIIYTYALLSKKANPFTRFGSYGNLLCPNFEYPVTVFIFPSLIDHQRWTAIETLKKGA